MTCEKNCKNFENCMQEAAAAGQVFFPDYPVSQCESAEKSDCDEELINVSNERIMKVVDCSDHKQTYGYLKIYDVTEEEVNRAVCDIKSGKAFLRENPDWTITDIFNHFPPEWKWEYIWDNSVVYI